MSDFQTKKFYSIIVILFISLIIQACGRDLDPEKSCNFVQNSKLQRVSWKRKQARMYIHSSVPAKHHAVIRAAAKSWNDVIGYEVLVIETVVGGSSIPSRDGYNVIYYLDKWEENKKSEQARTTIYWTGDNIYEADIRLNGRYHRFSVDDKPKPGHVDLLSLDIHEFGHVLGMAHIEPLVKSVMHAHLASGLDRRSITDTDKESIKCEY